MTQKTCFLSCLPPRPQFPLVQWQGSTRRGLWSHPALTFLHSGIPTGRPPGPRAGRENRAVAVCHCGRTVEPIEPVVSCNGQMAHVVKVNSSVGLVRGAEKICCSWGLSRDSQPSVHRLRQPCVRQATLSFILPQPEGRWRAVLKDTMGTKQPGVLGVMPFMVLVLWLVGKTIIL